MKCSSCKNGFNGRNGNGYQPCSCKPNNNQPTLTIDNGGEVLTETLDGVTMPIDYSFEKVNGWIHGIDVQFEELQALCLGMANENDRLRKLLKETGGE